MNHQRIWQLTLTLFSAFLLGAFVFLSFKTFFADSELWSVNMGFHGASQWFKSWVLTRPLFYFSLYLAQLFTDSPIINLYLVRIVMLVVTGVSVWTAFKIINHKKGLFAFLVFLVLVFAHPSFLNQGFRIRSDFFSTALTLISLYYFLTQRRKSFWDILFLFLPLLATPKAIYHVIALLAFRPWFYMKLRWPQGRPWLVSWLAAVAVTAALLGLWLSDALHNMIDYYLSTYSMGAGSPPYFSVAAYEHILKSLQDGWLFYCLFFITIWVLLVQQRKEFFKSEFNQFILLSLCFLFFSSEKVPFFIGSYIPLLTLWLVLQWNFDAAFRYVKSIYIVGSVLSVVLLFNSFLWIQENLEENSNRAQLTSIRAMESYIQRNKIKSVFDGFGLLPKYDKYLKFVGPNQTEINQQIVELALPKNPPDLILYTAKLHSLEPEMGQFLRNNYIDYGLGRFVYAYDLSGSSLEDILKFISKLKNPLVTATQNETFLKQISIFTEIREVRPVQKGVAQRWVEMSVYQLEQLVRTTDIKVNKLTFFLPPREGLDATFEDAFKFDSKF